MYDVSALQEIFTINMSKNAHCFFRKQYGYGVYGVSGHSSLHFEF